MSVAAAALRQRSSSSPRQPTGLRLLPVPESEPPFDDTVPALRLVPPERDGTLPLPFPDFEPAQERPRLRLVPDDLPSAPAPVTATPPPVVRPVAKAAEAAALLIAQILTGERPPGSIRPVAAGEVFALLCRKAAFAPRGVRPRAVLRAVHVCCPTPDAAEVVTVIHGLPRPKALAFRLESRRNRWICTALELG